MKLKDFSLVATSNYIVGVEQEGKTVTEFYNDDEMKLKSFENYIVTGIWVGDTDTMCVTISEDN